MNFSKVSNLYYAVYISFDFALIKIEGENNNVLSNQSFSNCYYSIHYFFHTYHIYIF